MTDSNEVKPTKLSVPIQPGEFQQEDGQRWKPAGAPIPYCCGRNYPKNADWERHLIEIHEAKPAEAPLQDVEFSQRMTTANRVILDASRVPAQPEKCPNCSHPAHVGVCPMPCLCGIRREPFFGDETAQSDIKHTWCCIKKHKHIVPDCCDSQCRCRIAPQPITAEEAARKIKNLCWPHDWESDIAVIVRQANDSATAEIKFSESAALEECARYLHKVRALEAEIKANQEWKRVAKDAEAEVKRLREQLAERQAR